MTCRKRRYPDRVAALTSLSRTEMRAKTGPNPQVTRKREERRAYPCPRCGGWHLTSKAKR